MKSKRICALATALLIGAGALATFNSCGRKKKVDYDPTKANITVATYDGGLGQTWLKEAAERFEKLYENDTTFQEGRTGVNIAVEGGKTGFSGVDVINDSLKYDMYLTEGVDYLEYVNKGKVADITDVVQSKLTAYNEDVTIESKLDPSFKSYLTSKDGKYYMLPFYDGFYGFTYDVDLFEEKEFYFDQDGDFIGLKKIHKNDEAKRTEFENKLSNGPDGKPGTYDDGLPATYDQFKKLIEQINNSGCIPFCFAGVEFDYSDKAFRAFIADYEGYDAMNVNYTLSGKDVELVKSIDANGNVTLEKKDISQENAYELSKQAGRYYALKMQKDLLGTSKYTGGAWPTKKYTDAQIDYINSTFSNKPYAFLLEGVWWENEAETGFKEMESLKGVKKSDRRFGFLPIPKLDETRLGEQTLFSANRSFCFINKECENMKLAKEFMRFLHTDAEMSKFTAKTSITRSLGYNVSSADRKEATHFGKSIIDMRASAKVVYPYSSLQLVINNDSVFTETAWLLTSKVNGATYVSPYSAYKDEKMSALDYFNGMYTQQYSVWDNTLNLI